eukprot:2619927-Alexandrium_andersonii.AAC.1
MAALAKLCPYATISPKFSHRALLACHAKKPCKFTRESEDQWACQVGGGVRVTLSKYRGLCADPA